MNFGEVIKGLKEGHNYKRYDGGEKWFGKVITMQIPSDIPSHIIPNMQSLNCEMKTLLSTCGDKQIHYNNQVLIVDISDGTPNNATYYMPTWEDVFAEDWEVV